MPVKQLVELPTPQELGADPEMAVVALLKVAMHVAAYAIIAENMELCAQEESHIDESPLPSVLTSREILEKMEILEGDLDRYRQQRTTEASAKSTDSLEF